MVIFTSGINRKIDFSHTAEDYSEFLLSEFLVLQLEQSTLFPAFKMQQFFHGGKQQIPHFSSEV